MCLCWELTENWNSAGSGQANPCGAVTEILEGLTAEDLIAFPYGKNVKDGAPTQEGDMSDLYGY